MKFQAPTGTFDIVPNNKKEKWRSSYLWHHVENTIRDLSFKYGFSEDHTPIFERAEVFSRNVGETSDIVSKEMYLFEDKGERLMALRPEGTAPVMRAFVENNLANQGSYHKLFYIGPMFRYDRPQAGRYRQHHQFGVEVIGNKSPEQDAEVLTLLVDLFSTLGLKNLEVQLNCLGDLESRQVFREALKNYLKPHFDDLSPDSQNRFETNPLRILDSKNPEDRKILEKAPSILEYISEESRANFNQLLDLLDILKIPYQVNPHLVRGLDYYNELVFEVISKELGTQNSLGGGGRYDGLLHSMGGPALPAIGFGAGIERIIHTLLSQDQSVPLEPRPTLYLIPIGERAKKQCVKLTHTLRTAGISTLMDFSGKKVGKAMQAANDARAEFVAVIGDDELTTKQVQLKEMDTGLVHPLSFVGLCRVLSLHQKSDSFMHLWDEMDKPFATKEEAAFFQKNLQRSLKKAMETTKHFEQRILELMQFLEDK